MSNKDKILLTGGNGMVGRNILAHPLSEKWQIFSPNSVEVDLTNFNSTISYIDKLKPKYIIHAAGRVGGIHANLTNPVDFLVSNLDIGRNVIIAAKQVGVKNLLNLGSSCMYPRNSPNPLKEEMILQGELEPTNEGYALAKIVAARLCEYIQREDSYYRYKTMIPCNIYGCYDKFDPERSHLIPAIINKIYQVNKKKGSKVEIWGDGNARREFMYAGDLADAIFYAISNFDDVPALLNIGVGKDYKINEYYSIAAEIMNYQCGFVHNLEKPVGMHQKLVSIEKQAAWGWSPKIELREGILKTYNYYLEGREA
jgi:GDP-L-fucose synthase